jgi:CheY-like chemotaxis protein
MNDCILVVDDDAAIRDFLMMLLADEGYEVCLACDGAEALDIVGQRAFQLILLDMMMPVMDGPAFLEAYCLTHPHVPIVAISAQEIVLHELACVAGCIAKPFNLEELLLLVHTCLAGV